MPHDSLEQVVVIDGGLSLPADPAHDLHGLDRITAGGGLAGEHNAVGAIQHSVGHIGRLSPCRAWVLSHGLQHLCGGNDRLPGDVALLDHHLLGEEHLVSGDLHAQVAPGHHHAVCHHKDGVELGDALLVLDLADDLDGLALLAKHLSDVIDVFGLPNKGGCDAIDAVGDAPVPDVLLILGGQRWEVHVHAWQVDVLPFPECGGVDAFGAYCAIHPVG
mmetsp:Transcript_32791/g.93043  ORF Transcript_32791/g.93043 Transcript_32791/m.93043 type:complete len:218 (-) Transcript_32791:462-1115(-)